ncbi:unnamed protein product [Chrysoparadoxa australica]
MDLPPGEGRETWHAVFSEPHKRFYFCHLSSGRAVWERPKGAGVHLVMAKPLQQDEKVLVKCQSLGNIQKSPPRDGGGPHGKAQVQVQGTSWDNHHSPEQPQKSQSEEMGGPEEDQRSEATESDAAAVLICTPADTGVGRDCSCVENHGGAPAVPGPPPPQDLTIAAAAGPASFSPSTYLPYDAAPKPHPQPLPPRPSSPPPTLCLTEEAQTPTQGFRCRGASRSHSPSHHVAAPIIAERLLEEEDLAYSDGWGHPPVHWGEPEALHQVQWQQQHFDDSHRHQHHEQLHPSLFREGEEDIPEDEEEHFREARAAPAHPYWRVPGLSVKVPSTFPRRARSLSPCSSTQRSPQAELGHSVWSTSPTHGVPPRTSSPGLLSSGLSEHCSASGSRVVPQPQPQPQRKEPQPQPQCKRVEDWLTYKGLEYAKRREALKEAQAIREKVGASFTPHINKRSRRMVRRRNRSPARVRLEEQQNLRRLKLLSMAAERSRQEEKEMTLTPAITKKGRERMRTIKDLAEYQAKVSERRLTRRREVLARDERECTRKPQLCGATKRIVRQLRVRAGGGWDGSVDDRLYAAGARRDRRRAVAGQKADEDARAGAKPQLVAKHRRQRQVGASNIGEHLYRRGLEERNKRENVPRCKEEPGLYKPAIAERSRKMMAWREATEIPIEEQLLASARRTRENRHLVEGRVEQKMQHEACKSRVNARSQRLAERHAHRTGESHQQRLHKQRQSSRGRSEWPGYKSSDPVECTFSPSLEASSRVSRPLQEHACREDVLVRQQAWSERMAGKRAHLHQSMREEEDAELTFTPALEARDGGDQQGLAPDQGDEPHVAIDGLTMYRRGEEFLQWKQERAEARRLEQEALEMKLCSFTPMLAAKETTALRERSSSPEHRCTPPMPRRTYLSLSLKERSRPRRHIPQPTQPRPSRQKPQGGEERASAGAGVAPPHLGCTDSSQRSWSTDGDGGEQSLLGRASGGASDMSSAAPSMSALITGAQAQGGDGGSEGQEQLLPAGWLAFTSSEGFVYYFNSLDGTSQWDPPTPCSGGGGGLEDDLEEGADSNVLCDDSQASGQI